MPADTDYTKRSDAQIRANLETKLDAIWRMGDRDETSIKHIWWGIACLEFGLDFDHQALDYQRPWVNDPWANEMGSPAQEKRLKAQWAKVERVRNSIGPARFHKIIEASRYEVDSYYLEAAAHEQETQCDSSLEDFNFYTPNKGGMNEEPDVVLGVSKDRKDGLVFYVTKSSMDALPRLKEIITPFGLTLQGVLADDAHTGSWPEEMVSRFQEDPASAAFELMALA